MKWPKGIPKLYDGRRWYVDEKGNALINIRSFRRKPFTKAEWNQIAKASAYMRGKIERLQ